MRPPWPGSRPPYRSPERTFEASWVGANRVAASGHPVDAGCFLDGVCERLWLSGVCDTADFDFLISE